MNLTKKVLMMPATALLLSAAAGAAQADEGLALERLDDVLGYTADYGFTQYQEISVESGDHVEVEGWLDDEWFADIEFSLDSGETLQEERERLVSGAWGMSEDDIRQAFEVASEEGMVTFEEIDMNQSGIIDIEGRNAEGREVELSVRQGSYEITAMDRD
ncbi:PepSY domain-containing protein [Vreelandella sp. GE22]